MEAMKEGDAAAASLSVCETASDETGGGRRSEETSDLPRAIDRVGSRKQQSTK